MNRKVNFAEIVIRDIEGHEQKADVRQVLGNMLYMQGQDIEDCELGSRIYHQDVGEPTDIDDRQAAVISRFAERLPYVMRTAIRQSVQ